MIPIGIIDEACENHPSRKRIRKSAKDLAKKHGCGRSVSIELAARREGYPSWNDFLSFIRNAIRERLTKDGFVYSSRKAQKPGKHVHVGTNDLGMECGLDVSHFLRHSISFGADELSEKIAMALANKAIVKRIAISDVPGPDTFASAREAEAFIDDFTRGRAERGESTPPVIFVCPSSVEPLSAMRMGRSLGVGILSVGEKQDVSGRDDEAAANTFTHLWDARTMPKGFFPAVYPDSDDSVGDNVIAWEDRARMLV